MDVNDARSSYERHFLWMSVMSVQRKRVKLIPVYYTGIVTGWGCTFCLHTVVGEGWRHKDFLNPLPGPKSGSAVCGYYRP